MKSILKKTTYILLLVMLLSLLAPSSIGLAETIEQNVDAANAAAVTIAGLSKVPVFDPAQCEQESIRYMYRNEQKNISAFYMTKEQRTKLISFFSGDNLVSVNADITEMITDSHPDYPQGINEFYVYNKAEAGHSFLGRAYRFRFDENNMVVTSPDSEKKILYQGWFAFKDENTYAELTKFLDELCASYDDIRAEEVAQEDNETNAVPISDLEILYSGTFPVKDYGNLYTWGMCSYLREGENEPVIQFYIADDPCRPQEEWKWFYLTDTHPVGNTLTIEAKDGVFRNVSYFEETQSGKEADLPTEWYFKLQINVTEDIKPKNIIMTYGHTDYPLHVDNIDMTQYSETGVFPAAYFSAENNVDFDEETTQQEEVVDEPDIKQEEVTKEEDKAEEIVKEEDQKELAEDAEEEEAVKETEQTEGAETEQNEERSEGEPKQEETAIQDFLDVPPDHWAYDAIHAFSRQKIVNGYGNGYFGTDDSITYEHYGFLLERLFSYTPDDMTQIPAIREEVIVSLVKALGLDVSTADETIIDATFSDCEKLQEENRPYIAAAISNGLVIGADGKLFADQSLTRAECVVLLARACDNLSFFSSTKSL